MGRKKKKEIINTYHDPKKYIKSRIPFYFGYYTRMLFVFITMLFICLVLGVFANRIVELKEKSSISIKEMGYANYAIHMKDNPYFPKVLGMDKSYTSSLVDEVETAFNYEFSSSDYLLCEYVDNISVELVILDKDNKEIFKKVYDTKEYRHLLNREKDLEFIDKFNVDYQDYLSKSQQYLRYYKKGVKANLVVSSSIVKDVYLEHLDGTIDKSNNMNVVIPLDSKSFEVDVDGGSFNKYYKLIDSNSIKIIKNFILLVIGLLFVLLFIVIVIFIKFVKLLGNKKSKYDKYVSKLLKEYDRLIVETLVYPNDKDLEKVVIKDFVELLDVRDAVKKPINYFNVVSHMKSIFYVIDDNKIYLYTLKAVDLEKK